MWKKISTIIWCFLLLIFAIYTLISSRGKLDFKERIGPNLLPLTQNLNFKFATFGDTHSCRTSLKEILQKSQSNNCKFAILLGDFVEFDDEFEYRYFLNRTKPLLKTIPLFLVKGNHETMAPGGGFTKNFSKYIVSADYSFIYGKCLFLILDNSSGELGKAQLIRCEKTLKRFRKTHRDSPIFIFFHIPPNLPGLTADLYKRDSQDLLKLASKYRVNYIFAGHMHSYSEKEFEKTKVIVSGCGGGSLLAPSIEVHFVEVQVKTNKVITKKITVSRDSQTVIFATY